MDNYNSNNGRLMAFYIICLASYVLGGLCLTQFKLTMQSVPQTVYLIIIVGLFFLYGIIFLFMLFQYLCRKDLTCLMILGMAFLGNNIFFVETIYIVQDLINDHASIEKRTNDIAIFYYFRQISFIALLFVSLKSYKISSTVIETKEREPCYIVLSFLIMLVIAVMAHTLASYNPNFTLEITSLKPDNVTVHWHIGYIYSLIVSWGLVLLYLIIKTKTHNILWKSIGLLCCSAILTNVLLLSLDEYSMYIWYVSRGIEVISALCIISILMYNTFIILKKETDSAIKDAMTKIYNRKLFYKSLKSSLAKGAVCVMVLDIDKFKRINDTYGHQEGDRVIISIVDIINKSIRDTDIFARVGGEEFAILLKCNDQDEAIVVAERIRRNVENGTTIPNSYDLKEKMTISIGVYCSKIDDESADKVVSYADAALYEAKNSGRNKVCYYYH
ncbi:MULTISPECIES: sensor domain-containing diguanylate cyclase [Citrobacter]|uniref:sensor domain-containing diguanylate cyclase n=1 Tax=Citrobacter TaxID=544 RepID=UPI001580E85C|nr:MULTISPECIES: sensor domain-containing diguanylate cyclase [Citrobacter freundii complex]EJG2189921.1 GGDEF domain-containing protein [Citrobacter freundii]ELT0892470.1 GGDEF domain-containing protein [Citrobacter freundii]MBA7949306.1 GGDEF domain-containing protein [Citrobacter freundii]MBJ9631276.1 GGDEF domain-containing protein [Citrobacter freundii]QLR53269.1 GGDEF domain-containing protein [Citrobacter freundii]